MTATVSNMTFAVHRNPAPASDERRAEILADPGFGKYFTDHLAAITWTADQGWHEPHLRAYGPIAMAERGAFAGARVSVGGAAGERQAVARARVRRAVARGDVGRTGSRRAPRARGAAPRPA